MWNRYNIHRGADRAVDAKGKLGKSEPLSLPRLDLLVRRYQADIHRQAKQNGAALALKSEHPATIAYRDLKYNSPPYPNGYTSSS